MGTTVPYMAFLLAQTTQIMLDKLNRREKLIRNKLQRQQKILESISDSDAGDTNEAIPTAKKKEEKHLSQGDRWNGM